MIEAALDLPTGTEPCDPLTVRIQGWVYAGERQADIVAVEAFADERLLIGTTGLLYARPDVSAALGISPVSRTGFTLVGTAPALVASTQTRLAVQARFADGTTENIAMRNVPLTGRDYRQGDWGILVDPAFPHLVRREHMYNSGPSQDAPDGELLTLLERYLPTPPCRVLDVGCGRGPYAQPLQQRGFEWFGVEIKEEDCAVLAQRGLPYRRVDGQRLPFADGSFDAAMCIEVLEHVPDPWTFVAEVRRVVGRRLIISVPNLEVVAYWRTHMAVPWHLLEADHKNFFSRASLRELLRPHFGAVEVMSYSQAPLRTAEGAAVDYHLLAIATV